MSVRIVTACRDSYHLSERVRQYHPAHAARRKERPEPLRLDEALVLIRRQQA